ncbi:MAG: 30S ribosomal protein S12 methylthiotransferase RimO, partial [Actinomycetota bacterium]|nr:30S ribosomal protein S12 methylthiotransferase RimO [Actinomycetota bacterium]
LDEVRLDWAGFFAFSREDGTVAAGFAGGVADSLVHERLRECSAVQEPITVAERAALVGREIEVLVDGIDDDDVMVGRTHREAPEIDGVVRLVGSGDVFARPGAVVRATVCGVEGPDLDAKVSG